MKNIRVMKMLGSGNMIQIVDGMYIQLETDLLSCLSKDRATVKADLIGYDYNGFRVSKPNRVFIEHKFIVSFNATGADNEVEVLVHSRKTQKVVFICRYKDDTDSTGGGNVQFLCDKDSTIITVKDPHTQETSIVLVNHEGVVSEMPLQLEHTDIEVSDKLVLYGAIPFTDNLYCMIYGVRTGIYGRVENFSSMGKVKVQFIQPREKKVLSGLKRYSGRVEIGTGIRLTGTYENSYHERVREVPDETIENVILRWLETT